MNTSTSHEELQAFSNDELSDMVACIVGYKFSDTPYHAGVLSRGGNAAFMVLNPEGEPELRQDVPRYACDLNVMKDVFGSLPAARQEHCGQLLCEIIIGHRSYSCVEDVELLKLLNATARQYALAYVLYSINYNSHKGLFQPTPEQRKEMKQLAKERGVDTSLRS